MKMKRNKKFLLVEQDVPVCKVVSSLKTMWNKMFLLVSELMPAPRMFHGGPVSDYKRRSKRRGASEAQAPWRRRGVSRRRLNAPGRGFGSASVRPRGAPVAPWRRHGVTQAPNQKKHHTFNHSGGALEAPRCLQEAPQGTWGGLWRRLGVASRCPGSASETPWGRPGPESSKTLHF